MSQQYPEWIWQNGSIKPWRDATTHVMSHALHYGSSVFEGIRSYATPDGAAIFRLTDHLNRLYQSAQASTTWCCRIRVDELAAACREVIKQERAGRSLPAPGGLPRPGRLRPLRGNPDRRRRGGLADGSVPRAGGAGERHRRLRVELAALRAEHHPGRRQGRRQLPLRPADRTRSASPRLRRRHRAGLHRPAQRRRRREPVPGVRRRAAHHARPAPRSWPASPATR